VAGARLSRLIGLPVPCLHRRLISCCSGLHPAQAWPVPGAFPATQRVLTWRWLRAYPRRAVWPPRVLSAQVQAAAAHSHASCLSCAVLSKKHVLLATQPPSHPFHTLFR
jgi:hypothetical protein